MFIVSLLVFIDWQKGDPFLEGGYNRIDQLRDGNENGNDNDSCKFQVMHLPKHCGTHGTGTGYGTAQHGARTLTERTLYAVRGSLCHRRRRSKNCVR